MTTRKMISNMSYLVTLLGCTLFVACEEPGATDDEELEELRPEPFAQFETDDMGTVEFHEPEPGALLIVGLIGGEQSIEDPYQGMDPIALYESLAGEPLPERFYADFEEGNEGVDESIDDEFEPDVDEPGFEVKGGGTNYLDYQPVYADGDRFRMGKCGTSDGGWCWTYGTDSSYAQRGCKMMWSYAHSYRGYITHRMRYKTTLSKWKTYLTRTVSPGYTSTLGYTTRWKRAKESKVYNASGDGYHHAGYVIR